VSAPKKRKAKAKASRKTDGPERRHGSSFERAILMTKVLWQARHCPGAERLLQKLMSHEGRYFDVLTLALTSDEVRDVYFDVTERFTAGLTTLVETPQQRSIARAADDGPTDTDFRTLTGRK
jgi:hypothetical protein